ncbi:MAG: hypothetical protein FWC11_04985 [Firmicutes bacterium]|nr:hypothetical protein [Bacillota bacterium]MCL2256198.1 hypothetical protein [Bacillota bacterium]
MEKLIKDFEELVKSPSPPHGSGEHRAWRVLRKKRYKREEKNSDCEQFFFISCEHNLISTSTDCIEAIKQTILENHDNSKIHYDDIAKIVFKNSMLLRRDIINKIIKPLIKNGCLEKIPTVNLHRYKDAHYFVKSSEEDDRS